MEFGFGLPLGGPLATPESLSALARRGEELGFGLVYTGDHLIMPRAMASRYPYTETGTYPPGDGECMDLLTLLTFLAARTSRIRLVTSVMVVPYRNPVHTAKVLATIDVLSNGRLVVGCGVGWMREEFEALGAPPYEERGAATDEYIRAFKELWTSDTPSFNGRYCRFPNVKFAPKPVQKPHPPVWIGGESPAALQRAARLGDGWVPIGSNPRFPLATPAQISVSLARLRRHAEDAGRDPDEIDLAYHSAWYDDQAERTLPDGTRRMFTGAPDQIAADIRNLGGMGVRYMMLGLVSGTLAGSLERMERFAAEVMPLTRN